MQQPLHHQQMVQQDQIGNPQQQHNMVQQQMMLCPVRLVYETPFLVQQGEQVQNQNIYINPQNPPPWARPAQNQVIYVQQLQPNMMPIQQMDPNQLYLQQNLANYQQLLAQQMLNQNSQDQRQIMQMQIPNMMQNVQTLPPNIQNIQSELPMGMIPNYATQQQQQQIQQQQQQTDMNTQNATQNHINLVPDPNNASRQIVSVQTAQNMQHNAAAAANQKAVDMQRQAFYRNVVPQNQQQIIRPQMPMAINQVQNMNSIQQIQQLANQNFAQNLRPQQQMQPIVGNVQQNIQPVMINAVASMQTQTQERPTVNSPNNTVTYSAMRNGQAYTFRAIQPKPPPYRNLAPVSQVQRPSAPSHNVQNINNTIKPNQVAQKPPPPSAAPKAPTIATQTYKQPEPQNNKKRKSESPDEISKKVSLSPAVYGSITVTPKAQSSRSKTVSYDIGVNTNPLFKQHMKMDTTPAPPVLQINPMDVQVQKVKETNKELNTHIPKPQNAIDKGPQTQPNNPSVDVKDHLKATLLQAEKERLARSTVFTQARGRVLNDKPLPAIIKVEEKPAQVPKESSDAFTQTVTKKVEHKAPIVNPVKPEPIVTKIETKLEIKSETKVLKDETKPEVEKAKVKLKEEPRSKETQEKNTIESVKNNSPVKQKPTAPAAAEKSLGPIVNSVKLKENNVKPIEKVAEKVIIKKEKNTYTVKDKVKDKKEYKNISPKDIKGKEIHMANGNVVKEEKDFVLTHVLDGYVIQESNVPFAIRKPLRERTMPVHCKMEVDDVEPKTKTDSDRPTERVIKDNSKILDLSHLQLNDGKVEEKEKPPKTEAKVEAEEQVENAEEPETVLSDSPFSNLQSETVKSWTMEQLTDHLTSHQWDETASILREHEIDGESLFLVSKAQLLAIGIKEPYAEIVCEFVTCK